MNADERAHLKAAVDAHRRKALRQDALERPGRPRTRLERCRAILGPFSSNQGGLCRAPAGSSGYCGIHARQAHQDGTLEDS